MAYEHRDGSGTLFKNDKKGNERAPDMRGDLMIDGTLYELAGWTKEGKSGKFLSLSAKPKEEKQDKKIEDMDDDLPF